MFIALKKTSDIPLIRKTKVEKIYQNESKYSSLLLILIFFENHLGLFFFESFI